MKKHEKFLLKASIAFALLSAITPTVNAMHIMEGYLSAGYCVAWGIICLPFLIGGFISLKNKIKTNRRNLTLIAMSGAFIFVISSLKIPSVTGSCSHMTGTGLGAILFGPALAAFGIYKLCGKLKVNRRVSVFLAAFLGDIFTYCVTSIQLALAYPSEVGGTAASAVKFLGVFAPTQLPLAVIEGILTVVIVIGLETYAVPELRNIGFLKGKEAE